MKTTKNLLIASFILASSYAFSQPYKSAIGVRLGFPAWANVDYKINFGPHWALDLAAGANYGYAGIDVAGMYHFDITKVTGLRWYLGASVDVGAFFPGGHYYYNGGYYYNGHVYGSSYSPFSLGTSIFGGVEYTFPNIPLNLAFDAGPRLPVFPFIGAFNQWARVGVTARYTFK